MRSKKLSLPAIPTGLMLIFSYLMVGCADNGTEPSASGTTGVKYTFAVSNNTLSKGLNTLSFTKAAIRVIELVFDADGPDSAISVTEPLTSVIDLINDVATPPLPVIELGPGIYRSLNMGLEIRDEDANPGIVLEGTFADNAGNITPFIFDFNSGEVFESDADLLEIPDGTLMEAKITFYPAEWFKPITAQDMLDAIKNDAGVVVISGASDINAGLFELMAAALDSSTQATFPGAIQDE